MLPRLCAFLFHDLCYLRAKVAAAQGSDVESVTKALSKDYVNTGQNRKRLVERCAESQDCARGELCDTVAEWNELVAAQVTSAW